MTRISEAADFDLGSFSFESENNENLKTNSGVCGSIVSSDAETEQSQPNPALGSVFNGSNESTVINLVAPHTNDNRVSLSIKLPNAEIEQGEYVIPETPIFSGPPVSEGGPITFLPADTAPSFVAREVSGSVPFSFLFSPVALMFSSAEFGGTPEEPNHIVAESGTIAITEVTEFTVSGSFNVMTEFGDDVTGSFSLDFNE